MRRWLTIALSGLVLSCQGPAAVLAGEPAIASRPCMLDGRGSVSPGEWTLAGFRL